MNRRGSANPFITNPNPTPHLWNRDQKRRHIRHAIDAHGFNWLVWEVAASGFFTDSYNLFATNVILPTLAYVYWPDESKTWRDTLINGMTLSGSVIGQLSFGYLADRFGRTRLYGIELLVVVFSTIGISLSSAGVDDSMSVLALLVACRFIMGIGIGAEYPLSASICTEWAPTKARARMMAAVFLMQPVGQLVSQLVGLFVLFGYDRMYDLQNCTDQATCAHIADRIWRWVTGVGAIPAFVAIYYRFRIKDPGIYDLDVKNQGDRALRNTDRLYRGAIRDSGQDIHMHELLLTNANPQDAPLPVQFSGNDIRTFFWEEGNWRYLLGTSLCWFLLDFAFYGLGMGSPRTIARLWTFNPSGLPLGQVPSWNPNAAQPNSTIYQVLLQNGKQNVYTVCIGSLLGSILLIAVIDYIPRKKSLVWSFLWLAVLFAVTGGSYFSVFHTDLHAVSIVLVALCHFSFNLGANTLTFIIPAEIFPTRYRCTCHGIAAASGKLGSIIVQVILPRMSFNGILASDPNSNGLGWIFIVFGFVMTLGAFFAWVWIPEIQDSRYPDFEPQESRDRDRGLKIPAKTLEYLGGGLKQAKEDNEIIGLRKKAIEPLLSKLRNVCQADNE